MSTAEDTQYAVAITYAEDRGTEDGTAAGSWVIDGNTSADTARAILRGIEDGDPEVIDTLPTADLSGQWADTLTGPELVTAAAAYAGIDDAEDVFNDICDAYEVAFEHAAQYEVERSARAIL